MRFVTREEMRQLDRRAIEEFGIPSIVLMEHAGKAVADEVAKTVPLPSRIAVVCGPKNNGGDGFVCVRHLINRGYHVEVFLVGQIAKVKERLPADPAINLAILQRMSVPIYEVQRENDVKEMKQVFAQSDLVVDALFGTGLKNVIEGVERDVIEAMNESGKVIVAVDVPSGLDCNEGKPLGIAVRAMKTVTMGLPKIGFQAPGAKAFTGEVVIADIGIPAELLKA